MLINIKDLQEGDEIIISAHSGLKYLKVLKTPEISKNKSWRLDDVLYKSVKCSVGIVDNSYRYEYGGNIFKRENYRQGIVQDITKHDKIIHQNLNHRDIWLVRRKEIEIEDDFVIKISK